MRSFSASSSISRPARGGELQQGLAVPPWGWRKSSNCSQRLQLAAAEHGDGVAERGAFTHAAGDRVVSRSRLTVSPGSCLNTFFDLGGVGVFEQQRGQAHQRQLRTGPASCRR